MAKIKNWVQTLLACPTHVAEQIIRACHLKERLIKWVRCDISFFYIAVIKYHDQNQLEEGLIVADSSRVAC